MPSWKDKLYQAQPAASGGDEDEALAAWKAKLYGEKPEPAPVLEEVEEEEEEEEMYDRRHRDRGSGGQRKETSGLKKSKSSRRGEQVPDKEAKSPPSSKKHSAEQKSSSKSASATPNLTKQKTVRISTPDNGDYQDVQPKDAGKWSSSTKKSTKSAMKRTANATSDGPSTSGREHSLLVNKSKSAAKFQSFPSEFDPHTLMEQHCQGLSERGVEGLGAELAELREHVRMEMQACVYAHHRQFLEASHSIPELDEKVQELRSCLAGVNTLVEQLRHAQNSFKMAPAWQVSMGIPSFNVGGPSSVPSQAGGAGIRSFLVRTPSFSGRGPSSVGAPSSAATRSGDSTAARGKVSSTQHDELTLDTILSELFTDLKVAVAERNFQQAQAFLAAGYASLEVLKRDSEVATQEVDYFPEWLRYLEIRLGESKQKLVEELGAVLEEARSSAPELRAAAAALGSLMGVPMAAHRLLACHSLKVARAVQELVKYHSSVAGDEDSLEYAGSLAQRTFLQVGLASDDMMAVFKGDSSMAPASVFMQWASKEARHCSEQLCYQVLAPFGGGYSLGGPVQCAHIAASFCAALEYSHSLNLMPEFMPKIWSFLDDALRSHFDRMTDSAKLESYKEVLVLAGVKLQRVSNDSSRRNSFSTQHSDGDTPSIPETSYQASSLQHISLQATDALLATVAGISKDLQPLAGPRFARTLVDGLLEACLGLAGGVSAAIQQAIGQLAHGTADRNMTRLIAGLNDHLASVFEKELPEAVLPLVQRCGPLLEPAKLSAIVKQVSSLADGPPSPTSSSRLPSARRRILKDDNETPFENSLHARKAMPAHNSEASAAADSEFSQSKDVRHTKQQEQEHPPAPPPELSVREAIRLRRERRKAGLAGITEPTTQDHDKVMGSTVETWDGAAPVAKQAEDLHSIESDRQGGTLSVGASRVGGGSSQADKRAGLVRPNPAVKATTPASMWAEGSASTGTTPGHVTGEAASLGNGQEREQRRTAYPRPTLDSADVPPRQGNKADAGRRSAMRAALLRAKAGADSDDSGEAPSAPSGVQAVSIRPSRLPLSQPSETLNGATPYSRTHRAEQIQDLSHYAGDAVGQEARHKLQPGPGLHKSDTPFQNGTLHQPDHVRSDAPTPPASTLETPTISRPVLGAQSIRRRENDPPLITRPSDSDSGSQFSKGAAVGSTRERPSSKPSARTAAAKEATGEGPDGLRKEATGEGPDGQRAADMRSMRFARPATVSEDGSEDAVGLQRPPRHRASVAAVSEDGSEDAVGLQRAPRRRPTAVAGVGVQDTAAEASARRARLRSAAEASSGDEGSDRVVLRRPPRRSAKVVTEAPARAPIKRMPVAENDFEEDLL